MLVWVFCFLISVTAGSNLKGKPVPGAIALDQILSRFLNKTDYTGSIFEYLTGNDDARRSPHNTDFGVLDRDNVRNIINDIKQRYQSENLRRFRHEAYYERDDAAAVKETALDMMKQSIYASKYRMNDTRRFRKHFQNDPSFHIAMYYGALMEISNKMETLFSIIKKLKQYTHFLWFLIIYEKILAANVDAHDMVDRIFYLHDKYLERFRMKTEPGNLIPTIPTPMKATLTRRHRRTRTRPSTMHLSTLSGQTQPTDSREETIPGDTEAADAYTTTTEEVITTTTTSATTTTEAGDTSETTTVANLL